MSTSIFNAIEISGISVNESFTLMTSYVFLILFCLYIKKVSIDIVSILLILYCTYLFLNVLWGGDIQEISRLTLPAIVFFITRIKLKDKYHLITCNKWAIIGFILPILISAYLILRNQVAMTVYWTGIDRYSGAYNTIHTLAHLMFIFLVLVLIFTSIAKIQNKRLLVFLCALCCIALFDLGKTYTRNVFIGLYIFSVFYLLGKRNYKILLSITIFIVIMSIFSSTVHKMMYDFIGVMDGSRSIAYFGTGRFGLWNEFLVDLSMQPFEKIFLGVGVSYLGATHNDILGLLYNFGVVGVLLYLTLIVFILLDIINSNITRPFKFVFCGFIISVLFMNFASNSYISRVELSQYFFFILGLIYTIKDNHKKILFNN